MLLISSLSSLIFSSLSPSFFFCDSDKNNNSDDDSENEKEHYINVSYIIEEMKSLKKGLMI